MSRLFIILFGLSFLFLSCKQETVVNYMDSKIHFNNELDIDSLFSIFPVTVKSSDYQYSASPPGFNCNNKRGYAYLLVENEIPVNYNANDYKDLFTFNMVIDIYQVDSVITENDCNEFDPVSQPIPYFYLYDFGLGVDRIVDRGDYKDYFYNIPSDLRINVVESRSGYYFKDQCELSRRENLKDWKHGYSKGIAMSEAESLCMYWMIVW